MMAFGITAEQNRTARSGRATIAAGPRAIVLGRDRAREVPFRGRNRW